MRKVSTFYVVALGLFMAGVMLSPVIVFSGDASAAKTEVADQAHAKKASIREMPQTREGWPCPTTTLVPGQKLEHVFHAPDRPMIMSFQTRNAFPTEHPTQHMLLDDSGECLRIIVER